MTQLFWLVVLAGIFSPWQTVCAQIVPDTTLPTNSTVEVEAEIFRIGGGSRSQSHLFHSFSEFSVPTGTVSFFDNPADVRTIFARITVNLQLPDAAACHPLPPILCRLPIVPSTGKC